MDHAINLVGLLLLFCFGQNILFCVSKGRSVEVVVAGSLLPPCRFKGWELRVSGLQAKTLTGGAIFPALLLLS